ncbi:MAG: metallophosphoesterase [Acidimicrobiia bacterium]
MDRAATNRDDIGRVVIVGDTHGNTKWVKHLTHVAARSDCPVIIQVGDFGYFPDHCDGPRFLSMVDRACSANDVELWFIDGNHDDHTSLAELEHGHVPVRVAEHVTYLPRGTRLYLGGCALGFLGEAFSVDWRDRTAGIDW